MATRIETRKRRSTQSAAKRATHLGTVSGTGSSVLKGAPTRIVSASLEDSSPLVSSSNSNSKRARGKRSAKLSPPPNLFTKALDIEHDVALELLQRMTQMRQLNALTPTPSSERLAAERLAAEHSAEEMPSGWRGYEAALAGMGSVLSPDDVIHLALSTGTIGNDIAWIALARGLKVGALHANLLSTQMQSQKKIEHDAESNSTEEHESTAHSSLLGQRCLTGEISIAPGAALACLLQRKRQVIVTLLNKKISRSGAFFEALQMSLDWEVPVLFVALHEPADSKAATQGRTWVSRAESFGLKAARCDGLCVLDVRDKTREALEWVRTHKMPFLLELTIPNTAREPNAPNDPVALFRTRLLEAGVMRDEPPLTVNS